MPRTWRRYRWMAAVLAASAALLFVFWAAGVRYNVTPSMPRGLYRVTEASPTRGDLVAFCLEGDAAALALARGYVRSGSCPSGTQPLVKRLVGTVGDMVTLEALGVRINGRLHPNSRRLPQDRQGRSLPGDILQSGRIPHGMALVLSADCAGGFDGRYFGLMSVASLRKVEPLWTFAQGESHGS